MGWLWKGIGSGTVAHVWGAWILPLLLAVLGPVVTGWLAFGGGNHAADIAIYVQLAFALTAAGCAGIALTGYYADLWIFRRNLKDKLRFASVRVGKNIKGPGHFLGIQMVNASDFPIEFQLINMWTHIDHKVPKVTTYSTDRITVSAGGIGYFDDHVIDTTGATGTVDGFIEYEIKYGHPGSPKYELKGKKSVTLVFDGGGNIVGSSFYEAN